MTETTWVAAGALEIVEAGEWIEVRHGELAGESQVGVRVKAASWVPDLLAYLRTIRSASDIAQRFASRSLGAVLGHLHGGGVVFHDRREEEAYLVHTKAVTLARRAMRMAASARVTGQDLREHLGDERTDALTAELAALSGRVDTLTGELHAAADALTTAQLAKLDLTAATDLLVHLGCGTSLIPEWVNIDILAGDVRADLRRGIPLPDGCARAVYTSHMLEHLTYPDEALPLLREAHRVLRPGGVIRVVAPDIEPCVRAYAAGDTAFFAERAEHWTWARAAASPLAQFLNYAGANRDPFDLIGHKAGYDFETLRALLVRAGFTNVTRSSRQASAHSDLRVDQWSDATSFTAGGTHLSLFVEAERGRP
jgi:SAM-dependent methyltransferase